MRDKWIERKEREAPTDPREASIYWANLSVETAEKAHRYSKIAAALMGLATGLMLISVLLGVIL